MTLHAIAASLERVRSVFTRKPHAGLHDDAPALAQWQGGMRVVSRHADGPSMLTDMPVELGGTGDQVTPGWLFRAGMASCAATSVVMVAATEGVVLAALQVEVTSRSDARGLLGMSDADGQPVYAGPGDMQVHVRIQAQGESPERLRALVARALGSSPIPSAVSNATPFALQVHIDD